MGSEGEGVAWRGQRFGCGKRGEAGRGRSGAEAAAQDRRAPYDPWGPPRPGAPGRRSSPSQGRAIWGFIPERAPHWDRKNRFWGSNSSGRGTEVQHLSFPWNFASYSSTAPGLLFWTVGPKLS